MIIGRYITREILHTLLAVLLVLLLIVVGRHFVIVLTDASKGQIASHIVFQILFLRTLTALTAVVPFALFIAVMVALGRLYRDNEMVAITANGIGPYQVVRSVAGVAVACSVLVAVVSFWVSPWANEKMLQIQESAQTGTVFTAVQAGRFISFGRGKSVFYVEDLSEDRNRLNDVFIKSERDGVLDVISARGGYQFVDPQSYVRYLVLEDGFRYQGMPGDPEYRKHQYGKYAVRLEQRGISPLQRQRFALSSDELLASLSPVASAELHWRLAMPIATLLLPLLAVFLSRTTPRQGRFAKLFIGVLVFVIYLNSLTVAVSWLERGVLPPMAGLWAVHAALLGLVLVYAIKHWGGQWMWYRFRRGVLRQGRAT